MIIAVPIVNGVLSQHFGHCESFALVEVNEGKQVNTQFVSSPPHQPGMLPTWLETQGANAIIAGGMGARAQQLFAEKNIQVILGAGSKPAEELVDAYLKGDLTSGDNNCDGGHGNCGSH